jgi:hypothetical protein
MGRPCKVSGGDRSKVQAHDRPGMKMLNSPSDEFCRAAQQIIAAPEAGLHKEINMQLNRLLGWPFRAASGVAYDNHGITTTSFGTLIFTRMQGTEITEAQPVTIAADTLACAIDVTRTIDLDSLRRAYKAIVQAKMLKKSPPPQEVIHTTITFGVIFAVDTAVPLECLADELHRLNQQTPSAYWPDMVVVASHGLISYAVQFPGELTISGRFLPPAEGALTNHVPAIYVVMIITTGGRYTFNQMMHTVLAHLGIFSPGAGLPDWEAVTQGVPNLGLIQSGYQYNLAGELKPVPPEHVQGQMLPQRPFLIQDKKGTTLATLQLLPWQDGGVILLRGKLPLDGLMVFLRGEFKMGGVIRREGLQLSSVLPISQQNFRQMLQRIQRQTNMNILEDPTKVVRQKFADEGASSPFMARLFLGALKLGDTLANEKQGFEVAYHSLLTTLLEIRNTAKEVSDIYANHIEKIAAATIVQMRGRDIDITESIDRQLAQKLDQFLTGATRSFKDRMQRVTNALGVNIGFLYQKPDKFERGVVTLESADSLLAAYIREARKWGETLVQARNNLEHDGWQLPKIVYTVNAESVTASEPDVNGLPVTEFVRHMSDRLMCFVEDITAHCIQARMPPGISITEIPSSQRSLEIPLRFEPTLVNGGRPVWQIKYHASAFDTT